MRLIDRVAGWWTQYRQDRSDNKPVSWLMENEDTGERWIMDNTSYNQLEKFCAEYMEWYQVFEKAGMCLYRVRKTLTLDLALFRSGLNQ